MDYIWLIIMIVPVMEFIVLIVKGRREAKAAEEYYRNRY